MYLLGLRQALGILAAPMRRRKVTPGLESISRPSLETARLMRPAGRRWVMSFFRSRLHWLVRESGSFGHGCNRVLTRRMFRSGLHRPPFGSEADFIEFPITRSRRPAPRAAGSPSGPGESRGLGPGPVTRAGALPLEGRRKRDGISDKNWGARGAVRPHHTIGYGNDSVRNGPFDLNVWPNMDLRRAVSG